MNGGEHSAGRAQNLSPFGPEENHSGELNPWRVPRRVLLRGHRRLGTIFRLILSACGKLIHRICSCFVHGEKMSDSTAIEWTDATWNPVTGCTKISAGCDHCYAERFSERFRGTPGHPFEQGFDLTLRPERLQQPLQWRRPRMIFVNSMSDLFHKEIPKRVHRARIRHHGARALAHVPGAHKAILAHAEFSAQPLWRGSRTHAYVVWRVGRGRQSEIPNSALARCPRGRAFPFDRTADRAYGNARSIRNRLGDRRWRKRAGCTADGCQLGARRSGSMRCKRRRVLFQAMGWVEAEVRWSVARWSRVEPMA